MKKLLLLFGVVLKTAFAATITVAVASNFASPVRELVAAFEKSSGNKVQIASGGTGALVAQISNGAPYQIFLAADQASVRQLVLQKLAVANTQYTYAIGQVVLWSSNPQLVDPDGKVLLTNKYMHLAIANPKLAPYGAAGLQVLRYYKLESAMQSKLVTGENINSTYQFIASGNAELGFVALSQVVYDGKLSHGGSMWLIPSSVVPGIKQDAVLLSKGSDSKAARAFLDYLKNPATKQIINRYGYK